MPPEPRQIPRFAAEPPQDRLPYGRWAQRLTDAMLAAWQALDDEGEDLGAVGEIVWYPDRTWQGWTHVPASAYTSNRHELFGFVRFAANEALYDGEAGQHPREPEELSAQGDFTEQTAERNPGWQLDLCEQAIGIWRGPGGVATMTLVWGRPLVGGGRFATAELGGVTVDQCELVEQRFTLIAPDDYQHDLLEIKLWGAKGQELARESLYEG